MISGHDACIGLDFGWVLWTSLSQAQVHALAKDEREGELERTLDLAVRTSTVAQSHAKRAAETTCAIRFMQQYHLFHFSTLHSLAPCPVPQEVPKGWMQIVLYTFGYEVKHSPSIGSIC